MDAARTHAHAARATTASRTGGADGAAGDAPLKLTSAELADLEGRKMAQMERLGTCLGLDSHITLSYVASAAQMVQAWATTHGGITSDEVKAFFQSARSSMKAYAAAH